MGFALTISVIILGDYFIHQAILILNRMHEQIQVEILLGAEIE